MLLSGSYRLVYRILFWPPRYIEEGGYCTIARFLLDALGSSLLPINKLLFGSQLGALAARFNGLYATISSSFAKFRETMEYL